MLTGGCYCGAIQYSVMAEPINRTICHCTMCRGTTGAPCVAWFTDEIDVSTCSLREPAAVAPTSHIFTASQLPWML